ncbi:ornithine cyclodeaminase family protein [Microlunatus ginsengisoli]|uniref:Ornithine cyclodeaminase family protein n=1 Tax=Microlunatus ginsengisoli TaxID=363863 RepID=A0ABP7A920_9ACTN
MPALTLADDEIGARLDPGELIAAVEQAHRDHADGVAFVPPRHAVRIDGSSAALVPMIAASSRWRLAVVKTLIDCPDNARLGRPVQQSTIQAFDMDTGELRASLPGAYVTRWRTAAASAVATNALAAPASSRLGFVGAGALARTHLAAISTVRTIREVTVWSRTATTAAGFADEARALGFAAVVVPDVKGVFDRSDIVCTLTPSRDPLIRGEWLRPGQHVNAVGAPPRSDHRELDSLAVRRARVVVDTVETALAESGDVLIPLAEGVIGRDDVATELGQVLTGRRLGRTANEQITVFDSVGVGLQDLAAVAVLLRAARVPAAV